MAVSTTELFAKMVEDTLIDVESISVFTRMLWNDRGTALGIGQKLDIGELSGVVIADAVDGNLDNIDVALSSFGKVANTLEVDQARAISGELKDFDVQFAINGNWPNEVGRKLGVELEVDRDEKDNLYLAGRAATSGDLTSTPDTQVNVAAAAVTIPFIELLMARMLNEKGTMFNDLAWLFHPFGIGSVRLLPGYTDYEGNQEGIIGLKRVGSLNGAPVFTTQSVPNAPVFASATLDVVTGTATITGVPLNAAIAVGHVIFESSLSNPAEAITVTDISTPGTVIGTTAAGDVSNVSAETLTVQACMNMLVNRDKIWQATRPTFGVRIIPYGRERPSDVIQGLRIWGRLAKANLQSVGVLNSPPNAIN